MGRDALAPTPELSLVKETARETETLLLPRPRERLAQRLPPHAAHHGFPESGQFLLVIKLGIEVLSYRSS